MAATADSPSVTITVGEIRNGKGLHLLVMILQIRSIPAKRKKQSLIKHMLLIIK